MPGPPHWRGAKLVAAVQAGEVAESKLDESVRRVLHLMERAGAFAHPQESPKSKLTTGPSTGR